MGKTKYEIVEELARNKKVEDILSHYSNISSPNDLAQMIYLYLLEMEDEKVIGLYERKELMYYIQRACWYNFTSKKTQYYSEIRKFSEKSSEIGEFEFRLSEPDTEPTPLYNNELLNTVQEQITEDEYEFLLDIMEVKGKHHKEVERQELLDKYGLETFGGLMCKERTILNKLKFLNQTKKKPRKNKNSKAIDCFNLDWNYIKSYKSLAEASWDTGVSENAISAALKGRSTRGGQFKWKYKE